MVNKVYRFSQHAKIKLEVLRKHGISLNEKMVVDIARNPEAIFESYSGRKIAQGSFDERRVLRIVLEERPDEILIITFYPGKRERYEKS